MSIQCCMQRKGYTAVFYVNVVLGTGILKSKTTTVQQAIKTSSAYKNEVAIIISLL